MEQPADALVELIDGESGHFGESRQAEGLVVVAVDVIDGSGQGGEVLALFSR